MIRQMMDEEVCFKQIYDSIMENGRLFYAGKLLQRAARLFPHNTALIYKGRFITYAELFARANSFSLMLRDLGVKPQDRVLISFENSPEFYIAYFATWQIGAVVAPVNTFLKEQELKYIVSDAQPKCIITSEEKKAQFALDGAQLLTETDIEASMVNSGEFEIPELDPDEMCALLYTSGTTGFPKGVMLSSRNIMTNIVQGISRLQIGYRERIFGVLPLFHVFAQNACVWTSTFIGAQVILVPKIERRLILEALHYKPTGFLGVPALYGLLCMLKTAPIQGVKYFISGGDAMPDKIRSYFELLYRRKICNGYGLTETSPLISADFDDTAEPTNSIGKPAIGVEIKIIDEQGKEVPQGYVGELWVKGDNVMLGYYNAPEQTEKVLKDGWFNTGDKVYLDQKGKLVIAGRTKDLIINKGINIYPQEIENIIISYPNVIRVGVIGEPDEQHGEIPIAYVQLREEEEGVEEKLRALCEHHLAGYKVPRRFICSTQDLPTTATGKVDKKVLRKQLDIKN